MKRFICVLLVICILMFAAGCANGGITEKDLVVEVGGETIELRMPSDASDEELSEMGVVITNDTDGTVGWIVIRQEEASLGCGLKVGDNVSEVIKVLGKNIIYDEEQSESEYIIKYYYYVKDGKLYGIADKLNFNRLRSGQLSEEEKIYFEKIEYDVSNYASYSIYFYISDNIVEHIELGYAVSYKER